MGAAREIVTRVQLTAVKARSIAAENETLDIVTSLDPILHSMDDPLSIIPMTEAMLAGDREPMLQDVMNLLYMASRSPGFALMYHLRWEEDPPDPMDALTSLMMEHDGG